MLPAAPSTALFDIRDRTIIVTGATGVLGGSAACYLATQGASVVFLGRDQARLDRALAGAQGLPGKVVGYACDVLDRTGLESVRDSVLERFGRIDALINAAGGNQSGATIAPEQTILDLDFESYRAVVGLNLDGTVLPSVVFAHAFARQGSGIIINFSSMASTQAVTRVAGYSNAKAAVDNFTRWLAVEFAQKFGPGCRVNAIAPGFFLADQNRGLLMGEGGVPTARGRAVLAKTSFGRFGSAAELHGALHFLLSDASAFVTGVVLPVDGGFACFSGV